MIIKRPKGMTEELVLYAVVIIIVVAIISVSVVRSYAKKESTAKGSTVIVNSPNARTSDAKADEKNNFWNGTAWGFIAGAGAILGIIIYYRRR